jgi:hypothetical protein
MKFVEREMCGSDCSCGSPSAPLYSLVGRLERSPVRCALFQCDHDQSICGSTRIAFRIADVTCRCTRYILLSSSCHGFAPSSTTAAFASCPMVAVCWKTWSLLHPRMCMEDEHVHRWPGGPMLNHSGLHSTSVMKGLLYSNPAAQPLIVCCCNESSKMAGFHDRCGMVAVLELAWAWFSYSFLDSRTAECFASPIV